MVKRIHKCPVPGCTVMVSNSKLMCQTHWHLVPKGLQNAVWRTYRLAPRSVPHQAAMKAAVAAVNRSLDIFLR